MKKIILALTLISLSFSLLAQSIKPHFISVNGGLAIPVGNFSKAEWEKIEYGYAKTGLALSPEAAFFFNSTIGIGAKYGYYSNPFNHEEFAADLEEVSGRQLHNFNTTNHKTTIIMIGPYFNFPLKKLTIGAKAMIGMLTLTSPDGRANRVGYPDYEYYFFKKESDKAIGYDLGASLFYPLSERISLNVNGDLIFGRPNLDVNFGDQPVSIFSLTTGISFNLNK